MKTNLQWSCLAALVMLAGSTSAFAQQATSCPTGCLVDTISGVREADTDGDSIGDIADNCPTVKNGYCDYTNNSCTASDGTAYYNCDANCDGTISDVELRGGGQADFNNNGIGDACDDVDEDGVVDSVDNCRDAANPDQRDSDHNGIGDACQDTDVDGIVDTEDNCPSRYNPLQTNSDGDSYGDVCDVCPFVNTPAAGSFPSGYHLGDECRGDRDSDGVADTVDNCVDIPNPDQVDNDRDRRGDACDNCPLTSNYDQRDTNHDGVGDVCGAGDGGLIDPSTSPGFLDRHLVPQGSGGCQSSLSGPSTSLTASVLGFTLGFSVLLLVLLRVWMKKQQA